jgi:hypothetical protein
MMSFVMLNADIAEFCYANYYLLCCVLLCSMFILSFVMLNAYTAKCHYAEIPYTECLCCLVSLYNVMVSKFLLVKINFSVVEFFKILTELSLAPRDIQQNDTHQSNFHVT